MCQWTAPGDQWAVDFQSRLLRPPQLFPEIFCSGSHCLKEGTASAFSPLSLHYTQFWVKYHAQVHCLYLSSFGNCVTVAIYFILKLFVFGTDSSKITSSEISEIVIWLGAQKQWNSNTSKTNCEISLLLWLLLPTALNGSRRKESYNMARKSFFCLLMNHSFHSTTLRCINCNCERKSHLTA